MGPKYKGLYEGPGVKDLEIQSQQEQLIFGSMRAVNKTKVQRGRHRRAYSRTLYPPESKPCTGEGKTPRGQVALLADHLLEQPVPASTLVAASKSVSPPAHPRVPGTPFQRHRLRTSERLNSIREETERSRGLLWPSGVNRNGRAAKTAGRGLRDEWPRCLGKGRLGRVRDREQKQRDGPD